MPASDVKISDKRMNLVSLFIIPSDARLRYIQNFLESPHLATPTMRSGRFIAYAFSCTALGLSFLAYASYVYMLGFPDGYISELGHAQRRLTYIFIGVSLLASLGFLSLGMTASHSKRSRHQRQVLIACGLYLLTLIGFWGIDFYYRLHLPGSGGG
jgi:hypothetical protein